MKDLMVFAVNMVAKAHDFFLRLNDSFELYLDDKQLHFVVMGLTGFLLFLVVRRLFAHLRPNAIAWVYTLTVMGMLAFAIEIGQALSHTGNMELTDIAMGMWGVLAFGAVYTSVHYIVKAIRKRNTSRHENL